MKKFLISAIIIAGTVFSAAAQERTAYFIESTTYRSQFNPAFAPTQGYVNFPLVGLGGLNFNIDGTLSVNSLLRKNPNGPGLTTILSSAISQSDALKGLNKNNNSFNFNTNINLLGFGNYFKDNKTFWSVDMNLHVETALDIPYSFFDFAKNLNGDATSTYDFNKLQVVAHSYVDVGFNYSMPIMENLYVGARAKFLIGLAHAAARMSNFTLSPGENEWNANMQAEMNFHVNGLTARPGDTLGDAFDNMKFKGPAGYGFAIDLGAQYTPIENLTVSLAVNDIGFISWRDGANFATNETGLSFSGVDMIVGADGVTTNGVDFALDEISLNALDSRKGNTTSLRATINAGVEYEMWDHWVGFGLLYHARMGLYKSSHNLTASVNFHPRYWFTLSPSYTFNNNRGGALGLALNFAPRGFNLFVASDFLLSKLAKGYYIPYKQSRMTFTLGMGFNIGRRGYRVAEYAKLWQQKEKQKAGKAAAKLAPKATSTKVTTK